MKSKTNATTQYRRNFPIPILSALALGSLLVLGTSALIAQPPGPVPGWNLPSRSGDRSQGGV